MKSFFSVEKFIEMKLMFVLEIIMGLILAMMISVGNYDIDYWDWKAFSLSLGIWLLSSAIDKKIYWNLATMLGTGSFLYLIWWFIFNLSTLH